MPTIVHKLNYATGRAYCGQSAPKYLRQPRYQTHDGRQFDDISPTDFDFWQCQRCLKALQREREKR